MSTMSAAPEGFVETPMNGGFNASFGPIYRHRSEPRLGFRVGPQHLNPVETVHGGAMATFADMMVVAVHEGAGTSERHAPTINLTVDYLGPSRLGQWVEMTVALAKATKTMYFTQAMITADGEPVARVHGIYRRYG